MSASLIFDLAPLGATVKYSDGTPRPPERHRKKLAAWRNRNSGGRLIAKKPRHVFGDVTVPESFTLHEGDFGGGGVVVLRVHRTFSIDSDLKFSGVERPVIGSVLVLDRPAGKMVHLAKSQVAADVVEGRAAA